MKFETKERKILDKIPKKTLKGRREFSDKLKKEIMDHYDSIEGKGNKLNFAKKAEMDQNTITRWGRDRSIERKKTVIRDREKRLSIKALNVNSIAANGRVIGTTLKNVLGNIDKEDVIQQIQMVEVLSEAGYDEDKLIEHLEIIAPSLEEWKQIKDALKLLSKNFDVEVKPKIEG